mmetsp:Transcript_10162/g.20988  ORF Transcript_10162/g.20988 Transcript_10162/m.20988 type:complete len:125 (-) Transcript_10162:363-737(-)
MHGRCGHFMYTKNWMTHASFQSMRWQENLLGRTVRFRNSRLVDRVMEPIQTDSQNDARAPIRSGTAAPQHPMAWTIATPRCFSTISWGRTSLDGLGMKQSGDFIAIGEVVKMLGGMFLSCGRFG